VKTQPEIRKAILEIKRDRHLKGRPATVDVNAPLALIQTHLEGQLEALRWVLNENELKKGGKDGGVKQVSDARQSDS